MSAHNVARPRVVSACALAGFYYGDQRAKARDLSSGCSGGTSTLSLLGLALVTFVLAKMLGLDLTFP